MRSGWIWEAVVTACGQKNGGDCWNLVGGSGRHRWWTKQQNQSLGSWWIWEVVIAGGQNSGGNRWDLGGYGERQSPLVDKPAVAPAGIRSNRLLMRCATCVRVMGRVVSQFGIPTGPQVAANRTRFRAETNRNLKKILSVTLEIVDHVCLKFRRIPRERSAKKGPTIRHYSADHTPLQVVISTIQ